MFTVLLELGVIWLPISSRQTADEEEHCYPRVHLVSCNWLVYFLTPGFGVQNTYDWAQKHVYKDRKGSVQEMTSTRGHGKLSLRDFLKATHSKYVHFLCTLLHFYHLIIMRKEYNSEKGRLKLLKGIVHPKMKMSAFTHPQVVANLYECVCSAEH